MFKYNFWGKGVSHKKLLVLVLLLVCQIAIGQNRSYNVYVDQDNNSTTGCTVLQPEFMTQFDGIDGYISVEIGTAPVVVTSSLYHECQGGFFDAGSAIVTSALGFNTNVNGDDVFEMQMNTNDLGIVSSTSIKLFYSAETDTSTDIVVSNAGGPIFLGVAFPIPFISMTSLLILSLLIFLVARKTYKNKPLIITSVLLFSTVVWGMFSFVIDGDVNDWSSLSAIDDPIGDNSSPSNSSDITQVFGNLEQDLFTARIDVVDVENQPPTITSPAAFNAVENQTSVADVQSTDPDGDIEGSGLTYAFTGSIDDSLFTIDVNTGVITFLVAPDFEVPGDFDGDNDYDIEVTVTDSGGLTDVQNIVVTVTNDINDDSNVEFSIANSSTADEVTPLDVVVVLNALAPLTAPLSVDVVDATGGTATSVTDYDAIGTQTVIFPIGAVDGDTMNVTLTPIDDTNVENNETVNLQIQNIAGPGFIGAQMTHTATITEDDVVTIEFDLAASSTTDESTPLDVIVELNISSGGVLEVAVTVDVLDALTGSATSATDYNAFITQTLTFAIGAGDGDSQNVTLTPIDDTDMEGDETVNFVVQNVAGVPTASLGTQTTHAATITDDDASVEFQSLSSFTVDEATPLNVVVVLSTPSALTAPISVDFVEVVGGTATTVTDYNAIVVPQTLTFPIGAVNGDTLNGVLTPVNDNNVENNETVNLQLENIVGLGTLGTQTAHVATITEDDVVTVEFATISSSTANEGTALNVLVQLNIPSGGQLDVAVTADTVDALSGSATSGNDYIVFGTQMVTFAIGSMDGATENVTLTPIDDIAVEGNETVNLNVQNVAGVPTASLGGQALHTLVITDDEAVVAFQNATSSTGENSLGLFQVIELTTPIPLLANLSVDVVDLGSGTATSGSDFVARGVQTVTFLAGSTNGATMTTPVVLQPIDDNNVENNETINLQLQNIVGTGLFGTQTTHELTIVSDDAATIEFVTAASATVDEATALNVVVSLTIPNSGELDVVLTADVVDAGGGTADSTIDYSAFGIQPVVFGIGTMSGATINTTLTPLDDVDPEGNETVNLSVQNVTGALLASVGVQGTHIATITDDDNTPPTAVDDAYNVTGNVGVTVPAAAGVLLNDLDGETSPLALTVTSFDAASTQGGVVNVASNGSFTYSPPAGYTGPDSFTYELSDGALPAAAPATVNLTIANKIWFIDNSAAAGDGALATPFNTIAAFNAVNNDIGFNPSDGECIYIDETGGGDYIGPMVLLDNQIVVGKGTTVAISTTCGVALATHSTPLPTINGTHPLLTSAGFGINLVVGNTLRGFDIGNATTKLKGGSVGTLTIDDMALLGTGEAIDIIGGNADIVFDSINSTDSPEHGMYLHTLTGSFEVTGLTYIDNATLPSIVIQNSTMNYMFGDVIIQRRNSTGVTISATGAVQSGLINTLIVNNQNDTGTNALVISQSGNGGLVTVNNLIVDGGSVVSNSAGLTLSSNNGNVMIPGGSIQNSFNSPAINVVGGTGDLNYGGSVSNTAGPSVNVESLTGGTITFLGNITDTGTGINLENNTGATIDFLSVININKASSFSPAFNATGGGTVSAIGAGSTIIASSGVAINIENTTIGAGNVTFQSATSNASAQHIGINLDTTGIDGSLIITGDGATPGSGGTIAVKTGADGSNTAGIGIFLNETLNPTFSFMQLNDFSNFAIKGNNVTGFNLNNSVIDGVNGTSAGNDEGAISFTNLLGSAAITFSTISGGLEDNIKIVNNTGELNRLTVSDSTIGLNSILLGNDGILFESQASAIANITVLSNNFIGARGDMVQCNALGNSSMDCVLRDNDFNNTHTNIASGGGGVTITGGGLTSNITATFDVDDNRFSGAEGNAITANYLNNQGLINGQIRNNLIGIDMMAGSGSLGGSGISAGAERNGAGAGDVTVNVIINNNTIVGVDGSYGVDLFSSAPGGGAVISDFTVTNNNISQFGGSSLGGINNLLAGAGNASDISTQSVDIQNNTVDLSGAANGGNAIIFDQFGDMARFTIEGYSGSANGETPVSGAAGTASTDIGTFLESVTCGNNTLTNGALPFPVTSKIAAGPVIGVLGTLPVCTP
jgi:hypothetical protein